MLFVKRPVQLVLVLGLVVGVVAEHGELPESLKRQPAEELNPWFLACLEPDEFGPDLSIEPRR